MPLSPQSKLKSPTTRENTLAIPVSTYAPISLERPLGLFGKTFRVHISTGLTLSPDTVLQVLFGIGLLQLMRTDQGRPDRTLNALLRAGTGRNKVSGTTRKLIEQQLGTFLSSEVLDAVLQGNEPTTPPPWRSDWEVVQQGLGEPGEDDLYQLVARLARLDRLAWSARQLADNGSPEDGMALLRSHIALPHEGWRQYNPNLSLAVAFLVDISLQTLAWLECRSVPEHPVDDAEVPASSLFALLAAGKKPIGHWLLRMQNSAACASLRDFSALMAGKGIKRHDYYVSHDLLKKWSSGRQLMPGKARDCVLEAVGGRVDAEREQRWFATARFLSFLCDLVIAGTREAPPSWAAAQEQISKRYGEVYLYEMKCARPVA